MTVRDNVIDDLGMHAITPEDALDCVLGALDKEVVRQQIVLEIDRLEHQMTINMVGTVVDAITQVLGKKSD